MSVFDSDIDKILDTQDVKSLLAAAASPLPTVNLRRELRRRSPEIELELAKEEEEYNQAQKQLSATRTRVDDRTNEGGHYERVGMGAIIVVIFMILAGGSYFFGWKIHEVQLKTWNAPFSAGWRIGITWTTVYFAIAILLFEIDFSVRRRPKKRARVEREEFFGSVQKRAQEAKRARDDRLSSIIRRQITEILNSGEAPTFAPEIRMKLDSSSATGAEIQHLTIGFELSETPTPDSEVPTDTKRKIMQWIESNPGGSIGISGPRGVGKTTLLSSICGSNPSIQGRSAISVKTSAPVEYASRDFLLHLFSALCRRVLATEGVSRQSLEESYAFTESSQRWLTSPRKNIRFAGLLLVFVSIPLFVASFLIVDLNMQAPSAAGTAARTHLSALISVLGLTAGPTATLGLTSAVFGLAFFLLDFFWPTFSLIGKTAPLRKPVPNFDTEQLIQRAGAELRNIRFQRSFTSGWSGSMTFPTSFTIGSSSGITLAQQPESLPELVERFRDFVKVVAGVYGRVIFGIDELDKLKSGTDAEDFLNSIKSVFGIDHCYYLISVSENALSSFDRRGIGFRDAFDSAFDEVLYIGFLDLAQSRTLLNRRILRLPDPFLQLCHMFSGGLPRDLIRQARLLLEAAATEDDSPATMELVTNKRVYYDLESKIRATSVAIRNAKETPATDELLARIGTLPTRQPAGETEKIINDFSEFLTHLLDSQNQDDKSLVKLGQELAAYFEMMMLIRRVASLLSTEEGWREACRKHLAQRVAAIRQALEVGVPLAQARILELRSKILNADLSD